MQEKTVWSLVYLVSESSDVASIAGLVFALQAQAQTCAYPSCLSLPGAGTQTCTGVTDS